MRADQWRLVLLQVFNLLLMAVAVVVAAVGTDRATAHYLGLPSRAAGPEGWLQPGIFGALVALAGGLGVLVLGIVAFRRMARGELYAPLFTALGWALLWLPLTMALTLLFPSGQFTPFAATAVCMAGIVLSLAVLGSKKPR
ncbi:hypothetical protein [Arthrobacter mobilis]|uniref:Uncharacterized protein n=1 Tax=Arthrobacter mobilis TaxID=2724944 RepID=A0A7X6HFF9_9MICC|nr:hypothetical protein [Arthrobacter mobilis]NKX55056.1 hypothetical protein [Arthrobacter mobilis]